MTPKDPSVFEQAMSLVADLIAKGFHVLGFTEMAFSGPPPQVLHQETVGTEPDKLFFVYFFQEHRDHTHFYAITLIKPDLNTVLDPLTSDLLGALAHANLDHHATVPVSGHA